MPFWVRRTQGTEFKIGDLGQIIPASSDLDLATYFDVQDIIRSADLLAALTSGDLVRLDEGMNPVPLAQALLNAAPAHEMDSDDDHKGGTQGDLVVRDASGWNLLNAGTSGQVLSTGGPGATPGWIDRPGMPGPTPPGSPYDGQIWYETGSSLVMYWDAARSKWLSTMQVPMPWGRDTANGTMLNGFGLNAPNMNAGVVVPQNATLVRIAAMAVSGNATKAFQVLKNGTSVYDFSLVNYLYKDNAMDIDLNEDDYIWVYAPQEAGTVVTDVSVVAWLAWRY